ncbi:Conserved oligomeric Golgi complex subunit 8 [Trichoplax sp. H2]|nr:Conserved oligomeric Golgi complex subunit 8 [Trichoplax sp. H2]|eukprot:RDD40462.1 Conserved oligomeric Golgi complex subunit 8 [Trichoplax sp. H2]
MADDETILSVFASDFPASWRNNEDFKRYVAQMSSCSIDTLATEPERLKEEEELIGRQTQDLAFNNYKTFIKTAECTNRVFQEFLQVEQHVNLLIKSIPVLKESCHDFVNAAQSINLSRKQNSAILSRHTQLLEILEVPQLMDTSVRNCYYEEALELIEYVKRLEKKLSSIPVIMNIVEDVRASTQLMLNQLLQQLHDDLQLPACLKVIGYIRRLNVFTEPELRIKFLQARDTWFRKILDNIPDDEPYYHISKTIEVSRVHLFDIITQYRAVFPDDDPLLSTGSGNQANKTKPVAIFYCWLIQKVKDFLSTLDCDLSRGVGGRLDSLLGQCMYFGLSFSRVGADFRNLLAPLFQRTVMKGFSRTVEDATTQFQDSLKSYKLVRPSTVVASMVSKYEISKRKESDLSPPMILLEFDPLAGYTNSVLAAFNEIRLCAPVAIAPAVAKKLQGSLVTCAITICDYYRLESTTLNQDEFNLLTRFCDLYANTLVPYLARCLSALFSTTSINSLLGQTVAQQEGSVTNGSGRIDVDEIFNVLKPFLPQKPPVTVYRNSSLENITKKDSVDTESNAVKSSESHAESDTVKVSESPREDVDDIATTSDASEEHKHSD